MAFIECNGTLSYDRAHTKIHQKTVLLWITKISFDRPKNESGKKANISAEKQPTNKEVLSLNKE